jgi:hypothetical protein
VLSDALNEFGFDHCDVGTWRETAFP